MSLLDDYFKTDKRKVISKESTPYDGDTIDGLRIAGVDAPEKPTWETDKSGRGRYTEGVYADEYTEMLEEGIDRGYDRGRFTGEKSYKRPVTRLETLYGSDYAVEYTKEGLLNPSRYAVDDINIGMAHANSLMNQAVNGTRDLPAWKQAEMLTTQALGGKPTLTSDQLTGLYADTPYSRGSGAFSVSESAEYWWMTNKTALDGLYALFDEEEGRRRILERQKEFGQRIDDDLVVSLDDIEGVGDAFAWLGNALVIQGPDYAIMAGGATAGAAIGTAILPGPGTVIGGTIGGFIGIGYNYLKSVGNYVAEDVEVNNEVNQGEALVVGAGITLLDRLGVRGVKTPMSKIFSKEGKEEVAQKMVDSGEAKDITEALTKLDQEAFRIVKDMRRDFQFEEAAFKTNKQITLGTIRELTTKGGEEAITEMSQELLQYITIHGTPQNGEDWKKMGWRLADAAAAGGAVGTVYSIPRSLRDRADLIDLRNTATSTWSPETSSTFAKKVFDTNKVWGETTVEEAISEYPTEGDTRGESFDELRTHFKGNYMTSGFKKTARNPLQTGTSSVKAMGQDDVLYNQDGEIIPEIALIQNIEGGAQTMSGGSLYNSERANLNQLEMEISWLGDPESTFKDRDALESTIRKMKNAPRDLKGRPITDSTWTQTEIEYAAIIAGGIQHTMNNVTQIYGTTKEHGKNVPAFTIDPRDHMNYYFQSSLPAIDKLKPHTEDAINRLADHPVPANLRYKTKKPGDKLGKAEAARLINNIIQQKDVRETARDLYDLQVEDVLKPYYPESEFDKLATKISAEVVSSTREFYRGKNNVKYARMINAVKKRHPEMSERLDEYAFDLGNQVDKHDGNFARMKSDKARAAQDYARTFTTVGVLDKSVFAQFAEVFWGQLGQDKPFLEAVQGIAYGWFDANRRYYSKKKSEAVKDYKYYGYEDDTVLQHGVAYDQVINRNINQWFFRLSQNAPAMEATRMDRMAGFTRVLSNLGRDLAGVDLSKLENLSGPQIEAYEQIVHMGGKPTLVVKAYSQIWDTVKHADYSKLSKGVQRKIQEGKILDPEVIEELNDIDDLAMEAGVQEELFQLWDHMVPKFVDEMVVRVKPGSRPAWFEDQRWGIPLLTQYLTYTAQWHANQLPRIYQKHMKGSSARMTYSAFAFAAGAILAAYYAQFLKDWITYGEESPYLSKGGDLHRALHYSGLFGWVGEAEQRFIRGPYGFGAAAQAFSDTDKSLVGETLESLFESPTISHIEKIGEKIAKGRYQDAAERAIPGADIRVFRQDDEPASALDLFFSGE